MTKTADRGSRAFLVGLVLWLVAGWVLYVIFGHQLVRSIYECKAGGILNSFAVGRATYPLEYYFKRADIIFIFVLSYVSIIALFVYIARVAFLKRNFPAAARLFFYALSIILLGSMLLSPPETQGDGPEYYRMTESLFNHLSPDWQPKDEAAMQNLLSKFHPDYYYGDFGYYQAKDGRSYCWHFWAYPFINLPVKFILHAFRFNEFKTFQVTNGILLLLALYFVLFVSMFTEAQRLLFAFFTIFSPALWYLRWPHPEIFSYSFVIISLIFMHRKKWALAILSAAIASTQNQPLIFLVAYLWVRGVLELKSFKSVFILSLSALPAATHNIFYYLKFGVPSLLVAKSTDIGSLSFLKGLEILFDLNIGMLPYIPVILFLFLGIVFRDAFLKRKVNVHIQLFLVMVIMILSCTINPNWNNGSVGPSRYVIWMLPFLFYVIVTDIGPEFLLGAKRTFKTGVVWIAIISQCVMVLYGGITASSMSWLKLSPISRVVLDRFPALYNPSGEIFCARIFHEGGCLRTPAVYYRDNKCRKALVAGKDEKALISQCGYIPSGHEQFFAKQENEARRIYINYYR